MNPDQKKQIEELAIELFGIPYQDLTIVELDKVKYVEALITQARIEELEMIIGIDEVWASPETKREHHRHRLAELNQGHQE